MEQPDSIKIDDVTYVRSDLVKEPAYPNAVILRAYSGVFFGELVSKDGDAYTMKNVRQIWSWDSAGLAQKVNTCGDIAIRGVGTGSRVSDPSPKAVIEKVGASFYCTQAAVDCIRKQGFK